MGEKNTALETISNNGLSHQPGDEIIIKPEKYSYETIATLEITKEEKKKLLTPFEKEVIQIRPDGLIYLPGIFVRLRLNEVFGPGKWGIWPRGDVMIKGNLLIYPGALFIKGKFISEALGEQHYIEKNPLMSWATAYEGAKTDCLVRCSKEMGINWHCWDPNFVHSWIKEFAIKVWRGKAKNGNGGEGAYAWRRKDADKFWDECEKSGAKKNTIPPPAAKSSTTQRPAATQTNNKPKTEFNPATETIGFGKHKGKLWKDVPKDYLDYIFTGANDAMKEKIKATLTHIIKIEDEQDKKPDKITDIIAGDIVNGSEAENKSGKQLTLKEKARFIAKFVKLWAELSEPYQKNFHKKYGNDIPGSVTETELASEIIKKLEGIVNPNGNQ